MGKVNPSELEEIAKKKVVDNPTLQSKYIGDKKVYLGPDGDCYDSPGEALDLWQNKKLQDEYKAHGLDEHGRSKEDVEKHNKIKALIERRNKKIEEIREIETQIGLVRSGIDAR